jgi:two-component system sensor kinase FixL
LAGEWALRMRRRGGQALRDLSEREAHMRSIFDSAPDALIVIDEHGTVQSYSAAARRMFSWEAAEVLGRNVAMLMPSPYRAEHDDYVRRYLETGEKRIIGIGRIVTGERKDGSTFPMELSVGELSTSRGRFFTGFVRDLTERQETEARLQELQTELVHISRLSAMGEMASALAHELNQPLSANANFLSGARRMLEEGTRDDRRLLEAVTKAAEQSLRAGEIIRRLRNFLARGEGERAIESLSKLVREACALALVGAKDDNVRTQYQFDPRADQVLVDRVQVQQVILNLVRNALDAMREHEGRRELILSTALGEGEMAMVSVIDTGPGLDPDTATRLFQPFVTTKAQGMGVGLSISRNIIEAHGGRIWTEANPAGGAIFRFTLRLAQAEAGQEAE